MNDILIDIIFKLVGSTTVDYLTFLVLVCTLFYVIRYTKITEKLQITSENQVKELIKQRELSTLPSLTYEFFKNNSQVEKYLQDDDIQNEIIIKNVGYGPALNLFFSFKEDIGENSIFIIEEEIPFLKKGAKINCSFPDYSLLKNPDRDKHYYFCFYFYDLQGNFFRQNHMILKGRRRFVRPVKVDPEKESIENVTETINPKELIPTISKK